LGKSFIYINFSLGYWATAGIELNLKKIGVGLNAQLPISQNFAGGQTKLKFKSMLHVTF